MLFSKEIQVNNFTSLDEESLSMYGAKPETINEDINMNSVLLTQIIIFFFSAGLFQFYILFQASAYYMDSIHVSIPNVLEHEQPLE